MIPKGAHYKLRPDGQVPPLDQASKAGNIYWVYGIIKQFWQKTPKALAREPFSLEELVTWLQLKQEDLKNKKDRIEAMEPLFCEMVLEHRLLTYLGSFHDSAKSNEDMLRFGRAIYEEDSTVITTNYDTNVEIVIEEACRSSSKASVPDWNRDGDSYCVSFRQPDNTKKSGFASKASKQTKPLVLKLHGSLNWECLIDVTSGTKTFENLLLFDPKSFTYKPFTYLDPSHNSSQKWLLAPLIIPMVLYKRPYYSHPEIRKVWSKAREELSECDNLVIMGYSFPPTDFHTKKLLIDALSGRNLKALTIVNPDTSVIQRIKDITHFKKPVLVCKDMREFAEKL